MERITKKENINKQNIPELRFPGFENEWDEILIGDKFDFFSTNSLSRAKLDETGEILNIHYGDIHTKFPSIVNVKKERIPFISEEVDTNKINKYELCKNGDLLIADASEDYADIGKTIEIQGITDEKVIGGLHTLLLRDKTTNSSPLFNGYLFQNEKLKKQIKIKANGISVLGISKKELQKISIKIPSQEEQKKISDLLFSIDQKIDSMETKHEKLYELKDYFIQNLIPNNQNIVKFRFFEFENDWITTSIGEIFDERSEKDYEKLELLSVTISEGVIKRSEIEGKDNSSSNKSNYKHVKKGDLVYNSMRMWQGASGVSSYEGIVSPAYTILIPKEDIDSNFYAFYFKKQNMLNEFQKFSQGLTSDTWNLKYHLISQIKIQKPSLEEQKKIADFLSSIDKKIELTEMKLDYMKSFKKYLLSKMFC